MKISIGSDLHLEFGPLDIKNEDNADVLILSGDIMIGEKPNLDFLQKCSDEFENTIYVAGNHEFYHGNWYGTLVKLKKMCSNIPRIHFLENESKLIGDVLFVGCTLWTDMNNQDPVTMYEIKNMLNDFRHITHDMPANYRRITPDDVVKRHLDSKRFIGEIVAENKNRKIVVVGHHAPSKASTHPRYADEYITNGAYSSDLSDFILDIPEIKVWTHGHTHDQFDYMIGSTRIICNPRGYIGYESIAKNFKLKTVEI